MPSAPGQLGLRLPSRSARAAAPAWCALVGPGSLSGRAPFRRADLGAVCTSNSLMRSSVAFERTRNALAVAEHQELRDSPTLSMWPLRAEVMYSHVALQRGDEDVLGGLVTVRCVLVHEKHAACARADSLELARATRARCRRGAVTDRFSALRLLSWPRASTTRASTATSSSTGQAKPNSGRTAIGQAAPAREPDHHLAVAVHARQRADDRDEQAEAQDRWACNRAPCRPSRSALPRMDSRCRAIASPSVRISIIVIDDRDEHHEGGPETAGQLLA
jgi:hypothetical protein